MPLIPKSLPLETVIGAPVAVPTITDPTDAQVVEARDRYVTALTALFEAHKARYGCEQLKLKINYGAA